MIIKIGEQLFEQLKKPYYWVKISGRTKYDSQIKLWCDECIGSTQFGDGWFHMNGTDRTNSTREEYTTYYFERESDRLLFLTRWIN